MALPPTTIGGLGADAGIGGGLAETGGLGIAAVGGYGIGSLIYNQYGVQINDMISSMTGQFDEDCDKERECELRLEREEMMCKIMMPGRYPGDSKYAVGSCMRAARRRYYACLSGRPEAEWSPLTGIDTPI